MATWWLGSHMMSQLKTQQWRQKQVSVATHLHAQGGYPTGDCEAVLVTKQGHQSPWEGVPCHQRWRADQECTGPVLGEAGGRGLGLAAKESRAPGTVRRSRHCGSLMSPVCHQCVPCRVQSAATGAPSVKVMQHRGKCMLGEELPQLTEEATRTGVSGRWQTAEATSNMPSHRGPYPQGRD